MKNCGLSKAISLTYGAVFVVGLLCSFCDLVIANHGNLVRGDTCFVDTGILSRLGVELEDTGNLAPMCKLIDKREDYLAHSNKYPCEFIL